MPTYTYRCSGCAKVRHETMTFEEHDMTKKRGNPSHRLLEPSILCDGEFRQVIGLGLSFARGTSDHYNHSLGECVRNDSDITSSLSRQSDEMSERMGFTVNYEPVDPRDPAAAGVTEQGLEATERRQFDATDDHAKKIIV